jgi:uncharacterized DUF497 family protein
MPVNDIIGFEWDEAKSAQCLRKRGFSFASVVPAFADPHRHVEVDERWEYGEMRYRLYGQIGGRLFVVVYMVRGRAIRIISARKANARERRRHGDEGTPQG